jgi:hypothetical protein
MSIKVVVYVPALDKELLPGIAAQFAGRGMECQFHPNFSLDPLKDSGPVSVRLRAELSGFEISFKDFRYGSPLSVHPTINQKLKACTKQVIIRMHAKPTSALRVGLYFAAFLAQLTDGIVYMPRSDDYVDDEQALAHIEQEVTTYETELPPEDWSVLPFTVWAE